MTFIGGKGRNDMAASHNISWIQETECVIVSH
jgi:hypothetical protein